ERRRADLCRAERRGINRPAASGGVRGGPGRRTGPGPLVSRPERRALHRGQHLLLVVDRSALVRRHVRRVMRRREERVDVARGDRQAEVVADEAAAIRAWIPGPGTRILRESTHALPGLLRIPREL